MLIKAIIATLLMLILACFCAWIGYKISRMNSKTWIGCFCISFIFIISVVLLHRIPTLAYHRPFTWLASINEHIVMAVCVPFCFALLIPRLRFRRQKIFISIFTAFITVYFVVPPFLDPALLYASMKDNDTWLEDDVCLQTTSYTCGAASAVTALKQFGIDAEEKYMAFASSTSRTWGAPAYQLARAIEKTYGKQGITCEVKLFDTINELAGCCPVIVIVKYRPMIDHYVTVLEVETDSILVGDPLEGKERLTYLEFSEKWRKIGIIVSNNRNQEVSNAI